MRSLNEDGRAPYVVDVTGLSNSEAIVVIQRMVGDEWDAWRKELLADALEKLDKDWEYMAEHHEVPPLAEGEGLP
jgi:hypothetical protein